MMQGERIDAIDVIERAPIGSFQVWICFCCSLVLFADGYNTQVIGFIIPEIAKAWGISRGLLGPIFSSGLIGLFVGYLFIAPYSGHFGHRKVMAVCAAIFGIVTISTTLVRDPYSLIIARFLTGIGLGGALPSALAYVGEIIPNRRRSSAATLVISGLSFGSSAAGISAALLLQSYGWKSVLMVGGALPIAVALLLVAAVPESYVYSLTRKNDPASARAFLERVDRELVGSGETVTMVNERPGSAHFMRLFKEGRLFGTLSLWAIVILNLLVNYALQNWLTTILVQLGRAREVAIATTTAINVGGILSGFLVGPLMDRFGNFRVLTGLFAAAAILSIVMGQLLTGAASLLLLSSFVFGFCSNGLQKGSGALAIHFYPPALRSTGSGWMYGVGRLGAILGPLSVGPLLGMAWSPEDMLYIASIPLGMGAVVALVMGRHYPDGSPAQTVISHRHGGRAQFAIGEEKPCD